MNAISLSRKLGWFSVGLGLVELLAPRALARAIGVGEENESLLRAFGARELGAGAGLLARPKPTGFMWSRVAGDLMDLGFLGRELHRHDSAPAAFRPFRDHQRHRLIGTLATVAAITAVDLAVSIVLTRRRPVPRQWRYTPAQGRAGIQQWSTFPPRTRAVAPPITAPKPAGFSS